MKGIFYRIGYNTLVQVLGKALAIILGFISVGLLTRYLGQEGFGNFSLAFVYLSFFGIIGEFGLQLTMVRELAKKKSLPKAIYGTYLWLKVFLVIFSTLLAIAFLLFFPYSSFLKFGIIIASFGAGLGVLNTYGTVIFQANLRLDLVALVDMIAKVVTVSCIGLFAWLNLGFYGILNTILIGNLAGSLLIAFLIKRFIPFNLGFDLEMAKKMLSQGLPVAVVSGLSILYFKIDTIILSLIKGAAEVGIYSLAYKIIENLLVFWGFYMATVYPLLAGLLSRKKDKEAWSLWQQSAMIAIGLSVAIIIFVFTLAPLIIRVLGGEEFKGSVIALRILLFSVPLFFFNNLYYHSFLVKEKMKGPLVAIGSSLIVNFMLNLIFIPKFGYIAAAANTVTTELYLLVLYVFLFRSFKTKQVVADA